MQDNWTHTIQQQEVMPPEGVWDTIALALDKEDKQPHWETRIYHATATPPIGTWEQIARILDASQHTDSITWQERLLHYEAVPPTNSWQQIAEQLDIDAKQSWPALIYQHETLPPQSVWGAIAAQMDANDTPVVPITAAQQNGKRIFRLVAAAVTIAAIAGTALWLSQDELTSNNASDMAANNIAKFVSPATTSNQASTTNTSATASNTSTLPPAIATNVANVQIAPAEEASATIPQLEYITNSTNETAYVSAEPVLQNKNKLLNEDGQAVMDMNTLGAPNSEFISISGPDGQTIRVSSKFANLLGYLNEGPDVEERLDQIIKESAYWKATFKRWREKMIEINLTPSLGNFMDVVELAKILQQ